MDLVKIFLYLNCVAIFSINGHRTKDQYNEELLIKQLPRGYLNAVFQFTVYSPDLHGEHTDGHYHLFPKAMGDILRKSSVEELHFSLTQGLWREEIWGYPLISAPPGAEIWAWFHESNHSVNEDWRSLVNSLSGLTCSSVNFIDSTNSITPKWTFRPTGVQPDNVSDQGESTRVRYGTLPAETVCTENLTPWKKLLPCGDHTGLGRLLNAYQLYDTYYHSLSVHYRQTCMSADCVETVYELTLSLSVVFNHAVRSDSTEDWSIVKLFHRQIKNHCPVADSSKIFVDISNKEESEFELSPLSYTTVQTSDTVYAVYDLKTHNFSHSVNLNVAYKQPHQAVYGDVNPPMIETLRVITGTVHIHGGITSIINNNSPHPVTIIYLEMVPWFIRIFLHTLHIEADGRVVEPDGVYYSPGKDRERPYHLELILTLPPHSVTKISYEIERAFLRWTEHPPDPHHGSMIGSAVLTTVIDNTDNITVLSPFSMTLDKSVSDVWSPVVLRLHTEILISSMMTPDFSMPYNVICLTCTVFTIAYGALHSLSTKTFHVEPKKTTSRADWLKKFLPAFMKKTKTQ